LVGVIVVLLVPGDDFTSGVVRGSLDVQTGTISLVDNETIWVEGPFLVEVVTAFSVPNNQMSSLSSVALNVQNQVGVGGTGDKSVVGEDPSLVGIVRGLLGPGNDSGTRVVVSTLNVEDVSRVGSVDENFSGVGHGGRLLV